MSDNVGQAAVVVPTRDRSDQVARVATSILDNDHIDFELVIVDQDPSGATKRALEPLRGDPRLRYLATDVAGKTRALNLAIEATRSRHVLFVDDDCEVPSDWISSMVDALDEHPQAALAFCEVLPAPHDPAEGFVPMYVIEEPRVWTSMWNRTSFGLGAGMAIRRDVLESIGGFDEAMGPGARFPSADDGDLAMRVLTAGWHVLDTPATAVVHHGFRTWQQGVDLTRRDFTAIGGYCAKAARCRVWGIATTILWMGGFVGLVRPLATAIATRRRPSGLRRLLHFARGFRDGWSLPVDRERILYRPLDVAGPGPNRQGPA